MKIAGFEFVCSFRESFKLWSQRLNVLASAVIAYVIAEPDVILTIIGALPPALRTPIAMLIGVFSFGVVTLFRLARQKKLEGSNGGK